MRKTKMPWFLCLLMLSTLGCAGTNGQGDFGTTGRMASRNSQRGPDFVSLVKKLQPTVVNVSVSIVPPVTLQPGGTIDTDTLTTVGCNFSACRLRPRRRRNASRVRASSSAQRESF